MYWVTALCPEGHREFSLVYNSRVQLLLESAWLSALAGAILILHLAILLATRNAQLGPIAQGRYACCGDRRETSIRQLTVFGGASAFDWGLMYWLLGLIAPQPLAALFLGYALMRFIASFVQSISFLAQAFSAPGKGNFTLKSHFDGCGYTTAANPLWSLFWLAKIPTLAPAVNRIRDAITAIDWFFSLPGIMLLNFFTLLIKRSAVLPALGPVAD